jgi:hypothetical protein
VLSELLGKQLSLKLSSRKLGQLMEQHLELETFDGTNHGNIIITIVVVIASIVLLSCFKTRMTMTTYWHQKATKKAIHCFCCQCLLIFLSLLSSSCWFLQDNGGNGGNGNKVSLSFDVVTKARIIVMVQNCTAFVEFMC